MRRELAQMTAQANEAKSLTAAAQGVAPTGLALKDALTASLSDHGLQGAQVQIVGNGVQIQMKNVSFPAWTQWLDDARRQFKVQVGEAHATALKDDGRSRPDGRDATVYAEMTQLDDASGGRPMRPGIKRLATALPWVLAGGLATAVTLVALAPAAWIAPQFARATGARESRRSRRVVVARLGHADARAGADQSAATLLPGRVEWTTRFWPLLTGRVQMRMRQTEAMPDAVTLDATWRGAVLSAGTMAVPASLLASRHAVQRSTCGATCGSAGATGA